MNDYNHAQCSECARGTWTKDTEEIDLRREELIKLYKSASVDGDDSLGFEEFNVLIKSAKLLAAEKDEDTRRELFKRVAKFGAETDSVDLQSFINWAEDEGDEDAAEMRSQADPSFYAGMARALTTMTRPLAQSLGAVMNLAAHKTGLLIAKYVANPVRLFKKAAVGTLEVVGRKRGSLTMAAAVRAEFSQGGVYALFRLAAGPYLFNSIVSLTMFETYTRSKEALQRTYNIPGYTSETHYKDILKIEGISGACAGTVQAVLNTPVYNVKRLFPGMIITDGMVQLYIKQGVNGLFADMPLMATQEVLGLVAFFASYEVYKQFLSKRVDEKYQIGSWVVAGMCAGMTLTAISHPFDNLHEWHIVHRKRNTPRNACVHFMQNARNKRKILTHGLAKRLPLGIPAGIPLLVYELMVGHESVKSHVENQN